MSLYSILDISGAGMNVQQSRLEAAALNLANAQTTAPPGTPAYRPLTVVLHSARGEAGSLPLPVVAGTVPLNATPRLVYDPGHPDADAQGFVSLPGVDPIGSMLDLISISRSYEANLRAFDVTRTLLQKTLDMGNHR
ncbi:MAG TPA: flagellar basal body rod protein FlgC [Steroidobacteraceae bacterium]|jgi:flagellar basal-body rod protein FlgC